MTDEDIQIGPEDIEYDLEGSRKAEARIAAFFRRGEGGTHVRTRGGSRPAPAIPETPSGIGGQLITRCPADIRQRYRTYLHLEGNMLSDGDYGSLIAPACAILEGTLRLLLADAARPIAGHLVAAVEARGPTQALDKWERRQQETTLGTLVLILLALRRGCERARPEITRCLAAPFQPRFADLLKTGRLGAALESSRTRFRNPADHAERTFDATAYGEFVRLVVANRQFAAWDSDGPDPSNPDAGSGVLYHHLQHALDTPTDD